MNNVTFVQVESFGKTIEHAIIDRGNDQFTSMPKATYDEMVANQPSLEV